MSKIENLYRDLLKAQERHSFLRDAALRSPVETSETLAVMQSALDRLEAADAAYEAEAQKHPDAARRVVLLTELKDIQAAIARAQTVPAPRSTLPPVLPPDFDHTLLMAKLRRDERGQTTTQHRRNTKAYTRLLDAQERHARALRIWTEAQSRYETAQQQIAHGTARVAHLQTQLQALPPAPAKLTGARKPPPSRSELMNLIPYIQTRYEYDPANGQVFDARMERNVNTQTAKIRVKKYLLPMHIFMGLLTGWKIDPHNGVRLRSQYPGAKNQWTQSLLYLETNNHKLQSFDLV